MVVSTYLAGSFSFSNVTWYHHSLCASLFTFLLHLSDIPGGRISKVVQDHIGPAFCSAWISALAGVNF